MKTTRTIAVSLAGLLLPLAAQAFTLLPYAPGVTCGSAPNAPVAEQTPISTFFAATVGVLVCDGATPKAGEPVFFTAGSSVSFYHGDLIGQTMTVSSDAQGIAVIEPGLLGVYPGTNPVEASLGASEVLLGNFTVTSGGPVRIEAESGSNQVIPAGQAFCKPLVARAFDASGNVVPRAAIEFRDLAPPSVTFDGASSVLVRGDDAGYATSPLPVVAVGERGRADVAATAVNEPGVSVHHALFRLMTLPARAGYRCR